MAYCTQSDLLNQLTQAELVQLTNDTGGGTVDTTKVDAAIAAASATIDAYAGARYTLPLQASDKIKQLAVDLAIYELEKRRRRVRGATLAARDGALSFLRDLARGQAVLDQPAGAPAQTSEAEVKKTEQERIFSDEKLEGF
ncbi:MAG: phage protein Gp36 family protein [Candidatus Acidiferrales bacterium]